jgi:hypothetical protein
MKLLLATYPRTGQHLLRDHISQKLNVELDHTHDCRINTYDKMITIARDPKEAIASWMAMELHHEDIEPTRKPQPLEFYAKSASVEHIIFHKYAIRSASEVFDYTLLNSHMDSIIDKISKKFNIEKTNAEYVNRISDTKGKKHIVSSQKTKHYEEIKNFLNSYDLSENYKLYQELYSMCCDLG